MDVAWLGGGCVMIISLVKANNKILEERYNDNQSVMLANAVSNGYTEAEVEVKTVTDAELAVLKALAINKPNNFNAQTCEGVLFTTYLPTLGAGDLAILGGSQSIAIILKCFSYANAEAFATLKAHVAQIVALGFTSAAATAFNDILLAHNLDLSEY